MESSLPGIVALQNAAKLPGRVGYAHLMVAGLGGAALLSTCKTGRIPLHVKAT